MLKKKIIIKEKKHCLLKKPRYVNLILNDLWIRKQNLFCFVYFYGKTKSGYISLSWIYSIIG